MDSLDLDVLKTAAAWLDAGHRCELVTVIKTWGSSPRPIGATLAVRDDGRVVGSVSGGCIEDDLIENVRAKGIPADACPTSSATASAPMMRTASACPAAAPSSWPSSRCMRPAASRELLARLDGGELLERRLDLASGAVRWRAPRRAPSCASRTKSLTTVHGPRWRLFIIGAGPLSRFLAQVAGAMDYRVMVCDPREEYRADWDLPGVELVHTMPDDLVIEAQLDARSAVVALTHDPKLDDLALMEALKSDAFYVGAIGSRLNNASRRERLKLFDLTDDQLDRLHGPIGLYIGSKTPSEIGISILAEMTATITACRWRLLVPHAAAPQPATTDVCARLIREQ